MLGFLPCINSGKPQKRLHWFGAVGQLCKRAWWGGLQGQFEGGYFPAEAASGAGAGGGAGAGAGVGAGGGAGEGAGVAAGGGAGAGGAEAAGAGAGAEAAASGEGSNEALADQRNSKDDVQHVFESESCSDLKVVWEGRQLAHMGFLVVSFVLCLAADGFNPWKGGNYTMWFIALKILNYKAKPGSKRENLIIVAIVNGPRAPASYKWYVRMVTDELKLLQKGVKSKHPFSSGEAWVYADLKIVSADHPGFSELLNCHHCGAKRACKLCDLTGTRLAGQRQFSYLSARRYLGTTEQDSVVRQDPAFGPPETRGPPVLRTGTDMNEDMLKAHRTKEPVNGMKGYSPLVAQYKKSIHKLLACDIAHNLKVGFKHFFRVLKGTAKMAPFKKPEYSKGLKKKYTEKGKEIPHREREELKKRTEAWELNSAAQDKIKEVSVTWLLFCVVIIIAPVYITTIQHICFAKRTESTMSRVCRM